MGAGLGVQEATAQGSRILPTLLLLLARQLRASRRQAQPNQSHTCLPGTPQPQSPALTFGDAKTPLLLVETTEGGF